MDARYPDALEQHLSYQINYRFYPQSTCNIFHPKRYSIFQLGMHSIVLFGCYDQIDNDG